MTAPTRVDELRKRYHENPRRFFAPLANEYRKTGFIDRAILLCEKHLSEQPGNMNGLIVYGQCLFESGRLQEAAPPFEAALEVDPENLIALRHLGDIARLGGDAPTARRWYERLLEVDRRNDEVTALLAEVGGGLAEEPAAPSHAPNIVSVAGSVSVAGPADSVGMIDLEPPVVRTPTPVITRAVTPIADVKTVEVKAEARPPRRMSLLDVHFDFGETPAAPAPAPVAPEALLPAEAAEYGFAPPAPEASAEEALDSLLTELPSAPEPAPAPAPQVALDATVPMARFAAEPLVEASPEGESLASLPPIEGLEAAEFSSEVSPLAGLEATEFTGGEATPLAGLDSMDFEPPSRPSVALEGLETAAFVPPADARVPETPVVPVEELLHVEADDAGAPSAERSAAPQRPSLEDLPLLEPIGTPTPEDTPTVEGLPLLPALEEAETVVIDPATMRARMETPTFVTETMAQLYVQQGHLDKAIDVYRQLIASAPFDQGLKDRLKALEAQVAPRPSLGFDTPLSTDVVEEVPPANAMLSAMSFDDVSLTTPVAPRESVPTPVVPRPSVPTSVAASSAVTPVITPRIVPEPVAAVEPPVEPAVEPLVEPAIEPAVETAVASGPSAREFFAAFARRAAISVAAREPAEAPRGPSAGGALLSPLDGLFGPAVSAEDEAAAHRLAGVGATSGPSGGSPLDTLFGEGPSAPAPAAARPAVPRASEKLKFDQFFTASSTAVPAPVAEPEPEPEPVVEMAEEPAEQAGGEDDDLDQFQGWLRGLTQ